MNVYPIRSIRSDRYKLIVNVIPDCYHSNHSDILRKPNAGAYWDSWDKAAQSSPLAAALIRKYFVRPAVEFYDLQSDPEEQNNLIDCKTNQEQIQKMSQLLHDWIKEQGDDQNIFENPYPVIGLKPKELVIKE